MNPSLSIFPSWKTMVNFGKQDMRRYDDVGLVLLMSLVVM